MLIMVYSQCNWIGQGLYHIYYIMNLRNVKNSPLMLIPMNVGIIVMGLVSSPTKMNSWFCTIIKGQLVRGQWLRHSISAINMHISLQQILTTHVTDLISSDPSVHIQWCSALYLRPTHHSNKSWERMICFNSSTICVCKEIFNIIYW